MVNVVKSPYGTAHNTAFLPNIAIAAKTGTAQNGANNTGLDDAVFTCFAPVSNPQIAVGVIVKGGGLGADASAPIAVKIIQAIPGLAGEAMSARGTHRTTGCQPGPAWPARRSGISPQRTVDYDPGRLRKCET